MGQRPGKMIAGAFFMGESKIKQSENMSYSSYVYIFMAIIEMNIMSVKCIIV